MIKIYDILTNIKLYNILMQSCQYIITIATMENPTIKDCKRVRKNVKKIYDKISSGEVKK